MPAQVFLDDDADLSLIRDRRVAVIGYGDQGQAQALSLRDSGVEVCVGLREGSPHLGEAQDEGLPVLTPAQCAAQADVIVLLAPDDAHRGIYPHLAASLKAGKALVVGHGFTVRFGLIEPPSDVDVMMVRPLSSGPLLRRQFADGKGVPVLVAVAQDATSVAWPLVASYAKAIGGTRAGAIATTFAEQCEADLLGMVLAGWLSALMRAGFDVLTEAGYARQVAYLACLQGMRRGEVAEYAGHWRSHRLADARATEQLRAILTEIRSGGLAREWLAEDDAGRPALTAWRAQDSNHPTEQTARDLRAMMSWVDQMPADH